MKSLIVFLTFFSFCVSLGAQSLESAQESFDIYAKDLKFGRQTVEGFDAAYKSYKDYQIAIKDLNHILPEYKGAINRLKTLFLAMRDAAYFYAGRNDQRGALFFARAYVEISQMTCLANEQMDRDDAFTELTYFAAMNTYSAEEYEEAIPFFKAFLSAPCKDEERREAGFQGLVECYNITQDYEAMKFIAERAAVKYPNNVYFTQRCVEACHHTNDDIGMERFLDMLLVTSPHTETVLINKAKLQEKRQDFAGALRSWSVIDSIKPNDLTSYYHIGFDTYNMAVQYYNQASRMNRKEARPIIEKAKTYFDKALPYLRDIMDNDPYAANVARAIAICDAQLGNVEALKKDNEFLANFHSVKVTAETKPQIQSRYVASQDIEMTDVPKKKTGREVFSEVDKDLPAATTRNENTYVVAFGNEKYKYHSEVKYASNDAQSFAEYCKTVLGIPKENIRQREDATLSELNEQIRFLENKAKMNPDKLKVIFYYAGHGIPDVQTGTSYLLPCDASGTDFESCLSLERLYAALDEMPILSATVFLDACFSGATRNGGMVFSERFVEYEPDEPEMKGHTIVFSATAEKQTAMPYDSEHHGFFTYYLLKNLKESAGSISYEDLAKNLRDQVDNKAYDIKNKHQTPMVHTSESMGDMWKSFTLLQ